MPMIKPRINVIPEESLYQILEQQAEYSEMSFFLKVRDLKRMPWKFRKTLLFRHLFEDREKTSSNYKSFNKQLQ